MSRELSNGRHTGQSECSRFHVLLLPCSPHGGVWRWQGVLPRRWQNWLLLRGFTMGRPPAHVNLTVCWCFPLPWPRHSGVICCLPALGPAQFAPGTPLHIKPHPLQGRQGVPGNASPLKKGSCSLLLLDQDVSKSWGLSLVYRWKDGKMGNFSSTFYTLPVAAPGSG